MVVQATIYGQLAAADNQIRLLQIIPSDDPSSRVCCHVRAVSLIEPPEYKALSYCWGGAEDTETIELNGVEVPARTNLVAALQQLRLDGHLQLWVDALCINQDDVNERASQVQLMKYIFEEAAGVVAWLGLEDRETSKALDFLKQEGQHVSIYGFMREHQDDPDWATCWQACKTLFERPYWGRVWIIQEIAVAKKVWVQCGRSAVSWAAVESLLFQFRPDLVNFRRYRELFTKRSPLVPLLQALLDTRNSLATDPRDKFYALLSLTNDGNVITGLPNYKHPIELILKNITKNIYQSRRSLNLMVVRRPGAARTGLPSWVPDWLYLGKAIQPWQGKYFKPTEIPGKAPFRFIGNVLQVDGIYIQTIDRLTAAMNEKVSETSSAKNVLTPPEKVAKSSPQKSKKDLVPPILISQHILETLALSGNDPTCTSSLLESVVKHCVSNLRSPIYQALLEQKHPQWVRWLGANREFIIDNKALGTYFKVEARKNRQIATMLLVYVIETFASPIWLGRRLLTSYKKDFVAWQDTMKESLIGTEYASGMLDRFVGQMERVLKPGNRLFTTQDGTIGMAPLGAASGDRIYLIKGCTNPVILRECDNGWRVIGEAYFKKLPPTSEKPEKLMLV
jgi:hypothetical protein